MSHSLKAAIQLNRQRFKYKIILARLNLRYFEYEDAGGARLAKFLKIRDKMKRRLSRLIVVLLVLLSAGNLDARPKYKGPFEKQYSRVPRVGCAVCHDGTDKKKLNNYGEALLRHVGKNEMDDVKIRKALTKTEPERSNVKNKTFGDLLKEGKLPASK